MGNKRRFIKGGVRKYSSKPKRTVMKGPLNRMINRAIKSNEQYNIHYKYTELAVPLYSPLTSTSLRGNFFQLLPTFPAQSLTSTGRQGRVIKNVKQVFNVQIFLQNWVVKTDPAAVDQILEMRVRVIVFTSDVFIAAATNIADFWNISDDAVPFEQNRVNRSKFTVIKDRVYRYTNETYYANMDPPAANVMATGSGKTVAFKIKRRWKQITFPTETSVTPADNKKFTYIAVIPNSDLLDKASNAVEYTALMTMYYVA